MRTSTMLSFRQAVSMTLCLCLTTSSVLAQKAPAAGASAISKPKGATKSGAGAVPVASAPATPAPPPPAPPLSEALTGQAQVDYQAARLLYGDGDFAGANLKFKQAFDASKDVRLLWNMAACEKNLRHYSKVYKLVERYTELGGSVLPESDKRDASDLLDAMKSYVSRVKFDVNVTDATITVDDEVAGMSPLAETVLLDMGGRRVRVTKPGFTEYSEMLQVQGASDVAVTINLLKETHEGRIAISAGADNMIYLDGKMIGTGRWDGAVASGTHALRVTAQGMKAYQTDVVLNDKETRTLSVTLEPEKKESSSAVWWVIGGVLVAGAAGSTVYLVTRNKDSGTTGNQAVLGTIQPGSVQLFFPSRGR